MRLFSILIIPALAVLPSATFAFEVQDAVSSGPGRSWLGDHLDTVRRTDGLRTASFHLSDAKVWSRGLDDGDDGLPVPAPLDKAMGARVRLLTDYDIQIGTELSRHEDTGRALRSELNWQFSWSRALQGLGGLSIGFGTRGAVESLHGGLSQSLSGSLGVPLVSLEDWKARLRVTPQLTYDSLAHAWRPTMTPEFVSETILSTPADPYVSLLNLRLGYDLAPDTRPSASARVELRFVPRP
jgi:hypothetical protein